MTPEGKFVVASKYTGYHHDELAVMGLGLINPKDKTHGLTAGFLYCEADGSYTSYGRSEMLDADSKPEDGQIITDALRDGKVRLEDMEAYGREGDWLAGNHDSMMTEEYEVATRDLMRERRITE